VVGSGQVRVLSQDGRVWGAGVLVADWVLTCAHVVTAALGEGGAAGAVVWLDRPEEHGVLVRATVAEGGWWPGPPESDAARGAADADVAVLMLPDGRPSAWESAFLGRGEPRPHRRVRVMGYPRGTEGGLWLAAELAGYGGPHPRWVQLDAMSTVGARVERGFSGAPVWDELTRDCLGLMTAAMTDRTMRVAWMVPANILLECWPRLRPGRATGPTASSGRRVHRADPQPSVTDMFKITEGLLRIPQVESDRGRALRDLLPDVISHQVFEHPEVRLQVFRIVQTCTRFPRGREALVQAVSLLGGSSTATLQALETLREAWDMAEETDWERGGGR